MGGLEGRETSEAKICSGFLPSFAAGRCPSSRGTISYPSVYATDTLTSESEIYFSTRSLGVGLCYSDFESLYTESRLSSTFFSFVFLPKVLVFL